MSRSCTFHAGQFASYAHEAEAILYRPLQQG
ncbi:hypothetical protein NSDW_35420 [Novosphingobium olei]|nr:hypothetical protein NSDW_35420 [Novosphingobium olei]